MANGRFVVLEGIDGSGTTTQMELLANHFRQRGLRVHTTAEPSTHPVGKLIRNVLEQHQTMPPKALALAFAADRLDHLEKEILPELNAGSLVIADRYVLSSLAYQSLNAPLDWVITINNQAQVPDVSFLLNVSPEIAAHRRASRDTPEELFDAIEKQRAIARAYESIFAVEAFGHKEIIDASQDIPAVNAALISKIETILEDK